MSIQVAPVQEVGKLIWGQTMTEEIPHEIHLKTGPLIEAQHPNFLDFLTEHLNANKKLVKKYYSFNEHADDIHHLEVLIQPPNFC